MSSARTIIAEAINAEVTSVQPYQAGKWRPALWQCDDYYVVAKRQPADGHAGMNWRLASDQHSARREGTCLWVSVSKGDEEATDESPTTAPMTWDEFRAQAVARAGMHALAGESKHRLAYLALGLCGEAGEFVAAEHGDADHAVTELGDVAWYLAMLDHETGLRVEWANTPDPTLGSFGLVVAACAVAEAAKRPMQGRDLPVARMRDALGRVARYLSGIAARHGGLDAVLAANVAKSVARYGDGFTADKARALDAKGVA